MKNVFFLMVIILFAFLSCRNDENTVQNIDQVMNIYIDSAGQDMLNSSIPGSYTSIQWNDINGLTDISPVSFSNLKNADTLNYLEYLAGARRIAIDSAGDLKTYESKIALILGKRVNDTLRITNDTMTVEYKFSPTLFQVSRVFYNDRLQFTKVDGQPNIIKIQK